MRWAIGAVVVAGVVCLSPAAGDQLKHDVDGWRAAHETQIITQFDQLVRFPSVAANPAGVAAAAAYLEQQLRDRGFDASLLTVPGASPVVFGSLATPGAARTVVFYAHYDGQPVTPAQWTTPPFDPVVRSAPLGSGGQVVNLSTAKPPYDPEWRLYGRSTGDDKISEIAFLNAFDALKALGRKPTVNIKVVWEGEEESGSPHLADILRANRDKLSADLWLIGDGPVHQSRRPLLFFGARGVIGLDATIYGPVKALHDGHYGNWVPNPAAMAATLIAELRAPNGSVRIPGFMDDVRPETAAERAAIAALPPVEDELKDEFEIGGTESHGGLADAIMRPALNVRGIRAGKVGDEAANAIPVDAQVSIDFRLVPDQKPDTVRAKLEAFLRSIGWTIVADTPNVAMRRAHAKLIKLDWEKAGYPAFRSDMSSPAARAVIAAATHASDEPVAVAPMLGGSVPLYVFNDIFHTPLVGLPVSNHDDNQHAANENVRLQNVWDGIDAYAAMMGELTW
ncbi:MAG TPA: M20/M25/M40 family metallo-hydrolase [Gemmatimonadaceae bacterium]|jgi:acetylornithine deacetylase/succinyl-diaminopimelate desuccinylase-like protein